MFAEPAATAVTCPWLLTVATLVFELAQVAEVVTISVVLLESVAVATSAIVLPVVRLAPEVVQPTDPDAQLIAIELATVVETVRVVLALSPPWAAVMFVVPRLTAVARPLALMVATEGVDDVQVAVLVTSLVLRSPKVPLAVNCCVLAVPEEFCSVIAGLVGETEMAARSWALTKNLPQLSA